MSNTLTGTYRNWKGETRTRTIRPLSLRFGTSEWHMEPQWLLLAEDLDTGNQREFALMDFNFREENYESK